MIPKNNVSYYGTNGKKNDSNLKLNANNFSFQIGKMDKDNETLYTKEFIAGSLNYLLKKVQYGERISIQVRSDLASLLKNENGSKNILSFEQEKKEIDTLIKTYFKYEEGKIKIVNVSEQYPEIFSLLKSKGIVGLYTEKRHILNIDAFGPLDIAKDLYSVAKNDPKFMAMLYATKTEEQKTLDNLPIGENVSDYYALIEIAIRLYEILTGKYIQ